MGYMINVDLETKNVSGGATDCKSELHKKKGHGRHFDLTVHILGCGCRRGGGANRSTRYWDDNHGKGYTLQGVVEKVKEIQAQHAGAYPRRCRVCGVKANPPHWD
jgi:hypothetical protein